MRIGARQLPAAPWREALGLLILPFAIFNAALWVNTLDVWGLVENHPYGELRSFGMPPGLVLGGAATLLAGALIGRRFLIVIGALVVLATYAFVPVAELFAAETSTPLRIDLGAFSVDLAAAIAPLAYLVLIAGTTATLPTRTWKRSTALAALSLLLVAAALFPSDGGVEGWSSPALVSALSLPPLLAVAALLMRRGPAVTLAAAIGLAAWSPLAAWCLAGAIGGGALTGITVLGALLSSAAMAVVAIRSAPEPEPLDR